MKKQLRNLIISLCVVVLVIAGVVSIKLFTKNSKSSSSSSTPTIQVFKSDIKKITTLHITGKDDITIHQANSKYSVDGLDQKILNQDTALNTFTTASSITADKIIDKNAANLSQYGLDKPKCTVEITGDKNATLNFGNNTPSNDGTYVNVKGSSEVYKVSLSETNSLNLAKTDLVNLSIYKYDSSSPEKLTQIELGGSARPNPIVLQAAAPSSSTSSTSSSSSSTVSYLMKSPRTYPVNDENISSLSSAMENFSATGVISLDLSDANLEKYGLKNPQYSLSVTYSGKKSTIDFGNPTQSDGSTVIPVVLEGSPVIYKVSQSTVPFYNWSLANVTNTMLLNENIENVQSITVSDSSGSYAFNLSGTGDKLTASYGSKKLSTDNLKQFYQTVVGITFEGIASKPDNAASYAKVVVTYKDASRNPTTMEFFTIDERRLFWSVDGQGDFYALKANVGKMITAAKDFAAGKTVKS